MDLASALVGHLVGDYLLQNDWQALHKKQSTPICLLHAGLWTASVTLLSGCGLLATAILFLTHFVQDRTDVVVRWMRLVGQEQFMSGKLSPWSIVVVDNVWHILTIWLLWKFL